MMLMLPVESMNSSNLIAGLPDYKTRTHNLCTSKEQHDQMQTSYKSKLLMNNCLNNF